MKTKIFCDIAEINLIKRFNKKKIKGVYNQSKPDEKSWSQRLQILLKKNFKDLQK